MRALLAIQSGAGDLTRANQCFVFRVIRAVSIGMVLVANTVAYAREPAPQATASWYGEAHRGKLMANGKKFNPDRLTAASWFYALGSKVRVNSSEGKRRSVVVTITDRGPAPELVRSGRIIDLSHAAFKQLATPEVGLVAVEVRPLK